MNLGLTDFAKCARIPVAQAIPGSCASLASFMSHFYESSPDSSAKSVAGDRNRASSQAIYLPCCCYGKFMANSSQKQRSNRVLTIGIAVLLGILTGFLWAYANPIQLVPGIIQWRIFAFLPPVIGILISPIAGFVSGYVGTVIWGVLSDTFIPFHTLFVDGVLAGCTGYIPAITTGQKFTLAQLAIAPRALSHASITAGSSSLLMITGVSVSFAMMRIYPLGWALLWIGLSNVLPVVIGTPIATRYGARVMQTTSWFPTERLK
jgi:hypothetical protein